MVTTVEARLTPVPERPSHPESPGDRHPPAGGMHPIEARGLTKRFGDTEVIHPTDLAVDPGTIIGLIGPSGSGKTTIVRLLTGLLEPTAGSATIYGTPANELSNRQRTRLGYLPQAPALFSELSLDENLSFHASMYGLPFRRRRRIDELLDWVELTEHRTKRVADSSGGMQRRLALAAAFVHDPDIVFLDEPTAGIDPILRDKFWEEFRTMAATGTTIVVTTQYVGEAGKCDTVGLLSDGEMVLLDTPENLRRAAFDGEVLDVELSRPIADADIERVADHPCVMGEIERTAPGRLRVVVDDIERATDGLVEAFATVGVDVVEIGEHLVDYDEAFVRVVRRHRELDGGPGDGERSAEDGSQERSDR